MWSPVPGVAHLPSISRPHTESLIRARAHTLTRDGVRRLSGLSAFTAATYINDLATTRDAFSTPLPSSSSHSKPHHSPPPPITMPPAPASRASIVRLMNATASMGCRGCGRTHSSAHSCASGTHSHGHTHGARGMATPVDLPGPDQSEGDYAFEVSCLVYPPYSCSPSQRRCSTPLVPPTRNSGSAKISEPSILHCQRYKS